MNMCSQNSSMTGCFLMKIAKRCEGVQVVFRLLCGEGQEPPHPPADMMFLTTFLMFLGGSCQSASMYRYNLLLPILPPKWAKVWSMRCGGIQQILPAHFSCQKGPYFFPGECVNNWSFIFWNFSKTVFFWNHELFTADTVLQPDFSSLKLLQCTLKRLILTSCMKFKKICKTLLQEFLLMFF
jgi:hypothetical protein